MLALSGLLCFITFAHLLAANITAVKYKINGPPVSLTGPLEQNFELTKAKRFKVNELVGPESFAFYKGHIYTGLANGSVVDISGPGVRTVANMGPPGCVGVQECGRPLGLSMDNNGRLIVADAIYGIVRVNVDTGEKELLFSSATIVNGKQSKFVDDVTVGKDGTIYFTQCSTRWGFEENLNIVLEGEISGRLLAYNETSNTTTVLVDNLAFANGVEFGRNEEYLLISETSRARIRKKAAQMFSSVVKGAKYENVEPKTIFQDFQTTFRQLTEVLFGVGFPVARHQNMSNLFDELANQPDRAERLARTYSGAEILGMAQKYGMIVELNGSGEIIRSLQDPTGDQVSFVTEVNEQDGCLYLGNLGMPYVSRVSLTTACHESTRYDPAY